jgi:hypothetical protein
VTPRATVRERAGPPVLLRGRTRVPAPVDAHCCQISDAPSLVPFGGRFVSSRLYPQLDVYLQVGQLRVEDREAL